MQYRHPSFWTVLRSSGLRAAMNCKAERMCVSAIIAARQDAIKHGIIGIGVRTEYKMPWWFTFVAKIEYFTRRNIK